MPSQQKTAPKQSGRIVWDWWRYSGAIPASAPHRRTAASTRSSPASPYVRPPRGDPFPGQKDGVRGGGRPARRSTASRKSASSDSRWISKTFMPYLRWLVKELTMPQLQHQEIQTCRRSKLESSASYFRKRSSMNWLRKYPRWTCTWRKAGCRAASSRIRGSVFIHTDTGMPKPCFFFLMISIGSRSRNARLNRYRFCRSLHFQPRGNPAGNSATRRSRNGNRPALRPVRPWR